MPEQILTNEASLLVRDGIYGRTRNPMYLALALLLTAGAVYWGDLGAATHLLSRFLDPSLDMRISSVLS